VRGTPYDTPILGYRCNTVNLLRLWKAEAVESFDFAAFNRGNYYGAVLDKVTSENITKVLYPNDESAQGKQLRLEQQYFFSACAIQDMIRLYKQRSDNLDGLDQTFAVQLNDTHPAIAVAELMRLLVDEHHLGWDRAWRITTNVFGYTNHTLLPEALERWPLALFGSVLPRHLEIIFEINRRLLDDVRLHFSGDEARVARMSLIDEQGERYVRMAHLACVGSHAINGVARLHTELLKAGVLRDFHEMTPEKFSNKTNGVTPRRFIVVSNPRLAELISRHLSDDWVEDLDQLRGLESLAADASFRSEWRAVKRANKAALAAVIQERTGVQVSADSLFDIHVKRIHEYKRQQLNVLHVVSLYNRLRRTRHDDGTPPRTVIFAGKAAPGYAMAKLIIKLIHCVADVVNHDSVIDGRLKVVFLPDFNVKNAQRIYPAADLSEQISTAGKEASGTGNMKLMMNGAVTIGTLDGANIEIREEVGHDNFFMFGLTAAEVQETKARGYDPVAYRNADDELAEILDQIQSGFFSPSEPTLFHPLVDSLLSRDDYMVLADYRAYVDCQRRVETAYRDTDHWTRMSILNAARMGYFSSDRAIREYCDDIWKLSPVPIDGPTA
jgi:starch phosphorylase